MASEVRGTQLAGATHSDRLKFLRTPLVPHLSSKPQHLWSQTAQWVERWLGHVQSGSGLKLTSSISVSTENPQLRLRFIEKLKGRTLFDKRILTHNRFKPEPPATSRTAARARLTLA
ncbi:hypothetical protein RRG08_063624 [Elysia crispata]|uniref:Uncharacterized protein n=1 Tax=Elysia crispata TaxID=231223 RepID=A0AAE1AHL4_9GAST|nr:hypothetical protein RRG08_063624 [Elysia crispata]